MATGSRRAVPAVEPWARLRQNGVVQPAVPQGRQATALPRAAGNQAFLSLLGRTLVQPKLRIGSVGDPFEQEADRAGAAFVRGADSTLGAGAFSKLPGGGEIRRKCAACVEEEEEVIQRQSRGGPELLDAATSAPLIVDDAADHVGPHQMRRSEFLAALRTAVCAAVDEGLAGTGRTSAGCPFVDLWFGRYADRPASQVERAIRRFAPEARTASTPDDYVRLIVARVQRSVDVWARTGEITGVPEEALVGSSLQGGAAPQGAGPGERVSFRARSGGAGQPGSPEAVRSQLGPGRPLDGSIRSRMEAAFGVGFGAVRVHRDSVGAGLSDKLNARAFTVGQHVAFGTGEYRPGTLVGDALIAHELAHVVQQGGAHDLPTVRGGHEATTVLEAEADQSAMVAVARDRGLLHGLSRIGKATRATFQQGLSLQRCGRERCPPGQSFFPKAGVGLNLGPGLCRWECWPTPPEQRVAEGPSIGRAPPPSVFDYEPTAVTTSAFFNANTGTCLCSPPEDPDTGEPLRSGAMIDCASVGIPAGRGRGGQGGRIRGSRPPRVPTPRVPAPRAPTPRAPTPRAPTPRAPTPQPPTPRAPTPRAAGGAPPPRSGLSVVPRRDMASRTVNDRNGHPVTIHGQTSSSSTTPGHDRAIANQADRMAQSGDYEYVVMQRSWRTATGRVSPSRAIPDVIGVRRDGRVDAFEVASRTDDRAALQSRLQDGVNTLPANRRGTVTVIDPEP